VVVEDFAVVVVLEAEDSEVAEDFEVVGDSEVAEDIEVAEFAEVEDLLEELVHHVQLQALEEVLIHMAIIDRIADITDRGGGIIDLGITGGGIPPGGRDIIIVPGIIAQSIWVVG
jgi:hypothetical protein